MINLVPLLGNWYGNTAHVILFAFAYDTAYAQTNQTNTSTTSAVPIIPVFRNLTLQ